ncbi:MAG TPA: phosphoglucosamine mutase [Saprospiraceae bacterium]|nr:phosphoglucosamine mutase [Saprospiraceae bacterium]HMQ84785.1 phosphoglucosamine mutase [Saprospiraceae bacterium]
MALIKSISGIRGTIGGQAGDNLTPLDIVNCTAAFGYWLMQQGKATKVVIGRDGRISGKMVSQLVANTMVGLGFEVIDLGLSTTPTVEMAVMAEKAGAGIIVTASHNPRHWNALKFLNDKGEFIAQADGEALLELMESGAISYAFTEQLGAYKKGRGHLEAHVEKILEMPYMDVEAVRSKGFKVVVDCINSTGALAMPVLLEALNCEVILINEAVSGDFAHNPEPLPAHLTELCERVKAEGADLGVAVDPDVDRLALVCEDGALFGEEYTLVAVADYILSQKPGNTVSNLSSTRALRDVTERYGGQYFAAAVGEVHVVEKMKAVNAVIGGEGNGGVIVPDLHYGRDALAGVALILSLLAAKQMSASALRATYPDYLMVKDKIELTPNIDVDQLLVQLEEQYQHENYNTIDGLKIDFEHGWVHLRKSNTEPIIRVYAEADTTARAEKYVSEMKEKALTLVA